MNLKMSLRTISFLMILLFTISCSNANITTNPATQPSTLPLTEPPVILSTPTALVTGENTMCANTYYPVRQGATWTYQSTGSPAGAYPFTDTITSARQDGFTLTSDFNGLTRTQEWSCKPEGLVALQIGGPVTAALNTQNMQVQLRATNISGVTFPVTIQAGDQWQHNLDFTGQMQFAEQTGDATGNAQTIFQAVGIESVSVPAGTFDAMKIQVETTVNMNVTYQGYDLPITFKATYVYWFAPNIGWVKAAGNGDIAGQTFTESIELQSYNIP